MVFECKLLVFVRYVKYMGNIATSNKPHRRAMQLLNVSMTPVPLYNKMR